MSSTPFDQGLFLVHLNRGREHFDRRNFADAAEELEEARKLRPTDDSVLNLLGLAYFKQEKYKEADAVYRKLIELNPESSTLHFNLGLVCFKLGDLDRAEATFLRCLELKPDNQKTHFYLGNIYEKKRQYYNAIFQYRKAGANIMVKRVQDKIDLERPAEKGQGVEGVDFTAPTPVPDETKPRIQAAGVADVEGDTSPNLDLHKVNVDSIDRPRFISALREGLFITQPKAPEKKDSDTAEHDLSGPDDDVEMEGVEIPLHEKPPRRPHDTQEEVLTFEEQHALEQERASKPQEASFETPQPVSEDTIPPTSRMLDEESRTRLRVSEPLVQDQSLAEMARHKIPESAGPELFSDKSSRDRRRSPRANIPPAEHFEIGEHDRHGRERSGGPGVEPNVYARGRRRDDIFRYLENNLMEVNFSGKVFIKQGTIYSYSGNLTFWVKPQREESVPPLVIVSGTGKLLLTDRQRDITVMEIEGEEIFVEPSHLLACEETLTPRYAVVEREGSSKGFHVLVIEGTGMLALSVATSPLVLTVQEQYPVNVSSTNLISWSGELTPTIVEDEALAELMLPGNPNGVNLRLAGEGRVMMEKSASY
jgi:uncharacterized protein (AIM24 family)